MKVLSLFDGMACGALALQAAGIEIEKYDAYEIDKYAIKTSKYNFPFIKHHGDVFSADFTTYAGADIVCGGSPCTHWSIAQKNNRETEASGVGWDLFQQYARAIKESKPKYFIYENNKSMSNAIRDSISDAFGFEPVLINSALVSAQNRQRLYWVGERKSDGGYSKIEIAQPCDKGILLRDILESGVTDKEKAYLLKHQAGNARDDLKKHHTQVAFEPVILNVPHGFNKGGVKRYKTPTLTANGAWQYNNYICEPIRLGDVGSSSQANRVYSCDGKSINLMAGGGGAGGKTGLYFCPTEPYGNQAPIYEVRNGYIPHNGKEYPIKLADGFYIIRKLTVKECMRLQTVPEWYQFPVSDTQAYKLLGNGWTVDVIAHILHYIKQDSRKGDVKK